MTGAQAVGILTALRADSRVRLLADDSSLGTAQIDLVGLSGHRQVTDLHLVNLAAVHDAVLVTFDRGIEGALLAADRPRVQTSA